MIKKQHTLYGIGILITGIIGGIAGTAFSMGTEQQRVRGALVANKIAIEMIKSQQDAHKVVIDKEMDRYVEVITAQMIQLQMSITQLTTTVGDLRTDVQVLKALMERMEEDFSKRSNSD